MRIAIFASGNGSNFENLVAQPYHSIEIALLICNNPDAFVIQRAKKYNIPTYIFDSKLHKREKYETMVLQVLQEYTIDFLVLAGYMKIVGETLLNAYDNKIISIHPALLPSFKGAHGIEDAYHYGVKIMGVTVHYVSKELDGGKIIDQASFYVEDNTSLEQATQKIHELEYLLYPKVLRKLFE